MHQEHLQQRPRPQAAVPPQQSGVEGKKRLPKDGGSKLENWNRSKNRMYPGISTGMGILSCTLIGFPQVLTLACDDQVRVILTLTVTDTALPLGSVESLLHWCMRTHQALTNTLPDTQAHFLCPVLIHGHPDMFHMCTLSHLLPMHLAASMCAVSYSLPVLSQITHTHTQPLPAHMHDKLRYCVLNTDRELQHPHLHPLPRAHIPGYYKSPHLRMTIRKEGAGIPRNELLP